MIEVEIRDKRLVSTLRIPVRWGDMDALGHVNNTVFFRFMEQARVEWLTQLGGMPDTDGNGPIVVNAHCTFLKSFVYPDDVEVHTYIGSEGKTSFETWQELRSVKDSLKVYAIGGAKVVWLNFDTQKSTRLPGIVLSALRGE